MLRNGVVTQTANAGHPPAARRLSTLDRYLPVWIGLAMAAGLLLGRWIPGLDTALEKVQVDGISLPIALGLLVMMYPVLAKVRYDRLDSVTSDRKLLVSSLVLNWVLGPALMFALAWTFLADEPVPAEKVTALDWDVTGEGPVAFGQSENAFKPQRLEPR